MAWNISAGAIRNPIPPIVLIAALVFGGLMAYFSLPVNQLPNIEMPMFVVTVAEPGAAPAEMETQITQRVESALTGVQGVHRVTSTVTPGVSQTQVELQIGANLSRAVEDARDAVTRIRPDLPAGITEPQISRVDFSSQPIAYYAVEAQGMSDQERSWFIDNDLSRELLAVRGVSQITRTGGVDREVRVEIDPERLTAYGISADSVSQQLRAQNADMPGGQAEVGGQAQSIRTLGSAQSIAQLAETRITAADGRSVRLADLGAVTDGSSDLSEISRFDGQPVVSFMVQRAKGASEIQVFDDVKAKLDEVEKSHPGMHFRLVFTPVDFIKGMHESSINALWEGAVLACLVVLLILRDWRSTLIAAAAIPLAVIPTFMAIQALGFTLNMMTLIALALVAGVLVDDAIVEIENIVRHMRMGKDPYHAAMEAADEIGLAVVATSASIIAVFLPVGFMGSQTGQWFKEFGLTVAIATFFSLVVARLITPLMCAYFLKDKGEVEKHGDVSAIYHKVLGFSIRRPAWTAIAGIVFFIFSMVALAPLVPFTFIPRIDNGIVQTNVEIPPGTPLVDADRALQSIAAASRSVPEVRNVFTSISGTDGSASTGQIFYMLAERNERSRSSYEVQQELRPVFAQFPDYRVSFINDQGGSSGADVTVQFVGQDPHQVIAAGDRLVAAMKRLPELADVRSSAALQRPELQIHPRVDDMTRLGVNSATLASAVRIATSGDVEQNLPRYNLTDRQIPIRVLIRTDQRGNLDVIRALPVQSTTGAPVRLDAVADVSFGLGEASVERRDRQRSVTVSANVVRGDIGAAQNKVFHLPEANPGGGVQLVTSGDTEQTVDMFSSFGTALLWGILLIYGVLVLLFRDFVQPLTIMTAFPLALGGVFAALLVANQPLSLFVLIGIIMLMGIVTKNSILLVDFAIEQMHRGMPRDQALMEAGEKRARPIVMTTFAMAAGMLPAASGFSVDGALRQGMGVAVIGGLFVSTMLSLVYVPAIFVLFDRLERLVRRLFGRGGDVHAPAPAAAE
ncbi:MAG TPA: efflux RND transporter permease subunit [Caulobacterales bacterium]|nr:efflux RND transporter permease subunit [Caulobacterales bacterium]